ncbi:hypothetical protein QP888_01875 [Corynebacterium sp. MSK297]|uniref:hypothetical protein n=1 Tax=Corynebacterium sp. MSK297 TaxID=3050221 RepID=UPI00254A4575|nr:hypothetical protein [Corynebacterium sp. MSK297]MDK8845281.1 hypothetical protein [Corynebacterium sp. MSK297]
MDTAEIVLQAAQLVVALAGLIGLVATIQQRTHSDNRSEWWKRYTWPLENITSENLYVRESAWRNINVLNKSALIAKTEKSLIAGIAYEFIDDDNEEQRPGGDEDV